MAKSLDFISFLPDELLEKIFISFSGTYLATNLILVCKRWKNIIESENFWIRKCLEVKKINHLIISAFNERNLDWKKYAKNFYFDNLFVKNLVKNPFGAQGFEHWLFCQRIPEESVNFKEIIENYAENRVTNWKMEDPSIEWSNNAGFWATESQQGVFEPLYDNKNKVYINFASSYTLGKENFLFSYW
jgi:hypothetical protein